MKKHTAAVVGVGRIGWTLGFDKKREQPASHVTALKKNRRIKLIAGVDNNQKTHALFRQKKPMLRAYQSVDELYQNCSPDIVVVAVNEDAHLEVALDVISRGPKLLILEKPVALNLKDAAKIKAAAKKHGVPILVNHERRFAYDYRTAAAYIATIGPLQSISAKLFSGMKLYDPAAEESGAYSLLHDGTHLVDIVLFLLESLEAAGGKGGAAFGESSARSILKNPVVTGVYRDPKNKLSASFARITQASLARKSLSLCRAAAAFLDLSWILSERKAAFASETATLNFTGALSQTFTQAFIPLAATRKSFFLKRPATLPIWSRMRRTSWTEKRP